MNETDLGATLFRIMALIHSLLRREKINLESDDRFSEVSVNCSATNVSGDSNILFYLNAEVRRPLSQEKQALGIELMLSVEHPDWVALGEVGWTGKMVGWDSIYDRRTHAQNLKNLERQLLGMLADLLCEFRKKALSLR